MKTAKQSIDLEYKGTKKRLNLRTALISLCMFAFVGTSAQTGTVTVKLRNASVKELFSVIEKQTSYRFSYRDAEIKGKGNVTISATNRELKQLLEGELSKLGLKYAVSGNKIIVTPVAAAASAQPKKVTGKVVDANGEPVIGATIKEQGTANGTITDFDGNFTLDVADNAMLEVSYIGYKSQELKAVAGKTLSVTLKEDTEVLDEVVVVGYGTQKKVNLTGAVSSVDFGEQVKSRPITNVSNALAGMSAGVQVMQNSGQPGNDGSSIRIRGIGTLNSNEPLVLVDGIEGNIDSVNPQDIENISILKDAASSSIYGSRAASGVVLITTKKGVSGKISVSYNGKVSYAQPTNLLELVTDYADYMEWVNESFENIGQNKHFAQTTIDLWREKSKDPNGLNEYGVPNYVAYPNTDWQNVLFTHGLVQDHSISVNGGTDKLRMLMSAGYLDNPGLVDNTGIKKYSFRVNLESKINKWLTIGTRTFAFLQDKESGNFGNANNYMSQTTPGVYPMWNGTYGYPEAPEEIASANNLLYTLNMKGGENQKTHFNTTFYSSVMPVKGLSWEFNLNYQRYWLEERSWDNAIEKVRLSDGTIMLPKKSPSEMSTSFSNTSDYSYTLENLLRYNTTFKKVHDFGVLVGYQEFYYRQNTSSGEKKGLIDSSVHTPGSATDMIEIGGGTTDRASRSFFGRINYSYKSKYLFEANLRHDGHSRYDKKHRWGTFPSFSAAWRLSEEDFMVGMHNWLDNFKIRISYGTLGNNGGTSVGDYEAQATYGSSSYSFGGKLVSGLAVSALANPLLEWETSSMINGGIDLNAFSNRLSFTFDAFYRRTTGILYQPSIPLTVGDKTAPRKNIAEMSTKGIEISLGWHDKLGEVDYMVSGNFSYTPNKVDYYKGTLNKRWVDDGNGYWVYDNLGEVSSSATSVNPIIEGHMKNEFFLKNPYQGTGRGFDVDGILGGPVDGMIRTETDMEWVKKMLANGYSMRPNNVVAKDKIWYGDYIYADVNGDGVYGGDDDRVFQNISSDPKYTFGMQFSVAWRGFDMSMNWAGQAGFKLYWAPTTGYNSPTTRIGFSLGKDVAENHYYYNPENPADDRTNINAKYGRLVAANSGYQNTEPSSLYLFNANYLKLKNITLGYTFPIEIMKRINISNLRLYTSIENVFSIDKYPGQDPELGATPGYTSVRQFTLGVNVSF